MSRLANVRAAIVARLNTVAGIGRVHDYERFAADQKRFRDLYTTDDGLLLGWYVSLQSSREVGAVVGAVSTQTCSWRIVGFMALDDGAASEKQICALIETAQEVFRAEPTLGGVVWETSDAGQGEGKPTGLQVEKIEPVMFAGMLCHNAHLSLVTTQQILY